MKPQQISSKMHIEAEANKGIKGTHYLTQYILRVDNLISFSKIFHSDVFKYVTPQGKSTGKYCKLYR